MKNYADRGGCYWPRWITPSEICIILYILQKPNSLRDLSEISRGEGGWKQREGHNFLRLRKGSGHEKWAVKRGRVIQIYACDHVEVHLKKKKEVLYLVKQKEKKIIKNNGTLWI